MLSAPVLARELPFVSDGETLFMAKTRMTMMAIAIAVAGAIGITSSALATPAPVVQLGIVNVGGTLTSGGSANYSFYFNTSATGLLAVKGTVTSTGNIPGTNKKWTAILPNYSTTLSAGTTKVTGTSVVIPTNFTGVANLTVTVTFAGKGVATKTVAFTVAAPVVAGSVSTNLYGVGFENAVTLNAGIVSTYGMGSTPKYSWTQTGGSSVVLSSTNTSTTSFTTAALSNFVDFTSGTNLVLYSDSQTLTNNHVQVVGLDDEQAASTAYSLQVLVSGNSITRTGLFTVACANVTPGHPNIPVGTLVSIKNATNSTSWTLLSRPSGSVATLMHTNSVLPQFRADVEGVYIIQDNVTGKIATNTAASWTGYQFCAICHGPENNVDLPDLVTGWSQTKHASFFQKAIDGQESSHYSANCIQCHTVGYDKDPKATNGGFDDVAKTLGWTFPNTLTNGNFAAMPAALQNLANIQCENCHGPGSRHPGSPSLSVDVKVCATCHQDGTNHVRPEQWANSPHSADYSGISSGEATRSPCSRCHGPAGFIDMATRLNAGVPLSVINTLSMTNGPAGPLACQTCHDPHSTYGDTTGERHQLRVFDQVQLGNPALSNAAPIYLNLGDSITTADLRLTNSTVIVTNLGAVASCTICHNARFWPTNIASGTNMQYQASSRFAPSMSPVAEVFLGLGAYDYGQQMGNSPHTTFADCEACHMYQLRAPLNGIAQDSLLIGTNVTAVNTATYNTYRTLLGDHTYSVATTQISGVTTTMVENIAACNQCHAGDADTVQSFDHKPSYMKDYVGTNAVYGIQTQTAALLQNLGLLINATGVSVTTVTNGPIVTITGFGSTGYSTTNAILQAQHKAVYNWSLSSNDKSLGVHNTQFTIRLLQTTYTDLSTNFYGNSVTNTFQSKFPRAYLR